MTWRLTGRKKDAIDPREKTRDELKMLPGVSDRRAALFRKVGVERIEDFLHYYPRAYEDWQTETTFSEAENGSIAVFSAQVVRKPSLNRYGAKSTLRAALTADDGTALQGIWFNQPWLKDVLVPGRAFRFRGKIERRGMRFEVKNPAFYADGIDVPPLLPVYPTTNGLTQKIWRDAVAFVLKRDLAAMSEFLPFSLRRRLALSERQFALHNIHFPADRHALELARERLKFEELFLVQLALKVMKMRRQRAERAFPLSMTPEGEKKLRSFLQQLPYQLTAGQRRAVDEIIASLGEPVPMHRLLQGDVGSGKTAVAAAALAHAAFSGTQGVLMAPTAVLARQHYEVLLRFFSGSDLTVELLTGQTTAPERRRILLGLSDGSIDIAVGTHALLEPSVTFARLSFCVTDEQHRFGVEQRRRLQKESADEVPHVLVMSATPIPRTLGLILYGDLDITVLDEMPPGRPPIETYTAREKDRARVREIIRKRVGRGEQVYVVCPLIEQSEKIDLAAATTVYNALAAALPEVRTALLHGSLSGKKKDAIMQSFVAGEIDVLVSTTVIEVGIDHENATLMIIENAERFGTAQLHQLRGRVGRGNKAGLCILMSDTDEPAARSRLTSVCRNRDGFALAEADLQQRGPGDFFGTRQHGLPDFRLVNLYEDQPILKDVTAAITDICEKDPKLSLPEHRGFLPAIYSRFGDAFASLVL